VSATQTTRLCESRSDKPRVPVLRPRRFLTALQHRAPETHDLGVKTFRIEKLRALLVLFSLLLLSFSARAQSSVKFAWDALTNGAPVSGYRLYQGVATRVYTVSNDVGTATQTTLSNLTAGSKYYFAVVAYNSYGESPYSTELTYTPTNSALPPAITLSDPPNGTILTAPADVALSAIVVPNGHTISQVQFYNGANLLGASASAPYSFTWSGASAGTYSLFARLVYDSGSTLDSSTASVSVVAGRPPPPSGSDITLNAASGAISSPFIATNGVVYQTVQTGVTNGGRAAYTFTAPSNGDYIVSMVVQATDNSADSMYVNIDREPTDPAMIWDIPNAAGFTNEVVTLRGNSTTSVPQFSPAVFTLSAGTHQLIIRGREPNTSFQSITISQVPSMPPPWQNTDIGAVALPGNASSTNGLYTISGSGTIGGSSDAFQYAYQTLTGDGDIRAQINSVGNTSSNALVGVMMRDSLTAGSRYICMGLTPSGAFQCRWRSGTGSSTSSATDGSATPPNAWVRLTRSGKKIAAYSSTDGTNWTQVTSQTINMASSSYLGLAVASGTTNSLNSSGFKNILAVP